MIGIDQRIPEMEFDAFHAGQIRRMKLSEFRGKWLVLMFYPADFTFVCPTELEDAAKHYGQFRGEGAEVVSVSTDTAYVHMAWHDNSQVIRKIEFPMAADPGGRMSKAFGTYIEGEGLSRRATFIIDPDGEVKALEMHNNSIGRSAAEILRKLQASKFVRENHGQLCPANWRPGEEAIKLK
ncbi:MAG: redoxin domain-containing protein [Candidatus Micrarchaeia archaeon]|jgi:peroxiredoxin (alkyl hydroperoxide reductase subunit C)